MKFPKATLAPVLKAWQRRAVSSLAEKIEGFELVPLRDGGISLRSRANGETFHPVTGPMREAGELHVAQQRLRARAEEAGRFVIWDVGLGAAANAIAAIEALAGCAGVVMESFDRTTGPLEFAICHAAELAYPQPHLRSLRELLEKRRTRLPFGEWRLHLGDFRESAIRRERADAVFWDPYSPRVNPEMWELSTFQALRSRVRDGCRLTTYTRSTAVRVTLLLAGFFVGRGRGIGEKEETTVAATCAEGLEQPLGADWLGRAERSTNGAPLRPGRSGCEPIAAGDLALLRAHPQFGG